MFNIKAQTLLDTFVVDFSSFTTMALFHVRFGARPQAKPSIISVYKLSMLWYGAFKSTKIWYTSTLHFHCCCCCDKPYLVGESKQEQQTFHFHARWCISCAVQDGRRGFWLLITFWHTRCFFIFSAIHTQPAAAVVFTATIILVLMACATCINAPVKFVHFTWQMVQLLLMK